MSSLNTINLHLLSISIDEQNHTHNIYYAITLDAPICMPTYPPILANKKIGGLKFSIERIEKQLILINYKM